MTAPRKDRLNIGYLLLDRTRSEEDDQALRWLAGEAGIAPVVFTVRESRSGPAPGGCDVLWVHISDRGALDRWCGSKRCTDILNSFYNRGGKILFTNFASLLPFGMGIESVEAEIRPIEIRDGGFGRGMGFQGFRGHPVFGGFHGGVYIWGGYEDHTSWRTGYFGSGEPREGKVVAVEKAYIKIAPDSRLIVEHAGERGRALSIGGFINFSGGNILRLHLERFMNNVFEYLASGPGGEPVSYWVKGDSAPEPFEVEMRPPAAPGDAGIPVGAGSGPSPPVEGTGISTGGSGPSPHVDSSGPVPHESRLPPSTGSADSTRYTSGLSLSRKRAAGAYCEVAGRRCLVMCREHGGIDEVWVHPFRLLSDFTAGVIENNGVTWLAELPSSVEIRPESITRRYGARSFGLTEVVCASIDKPGGLVRYSLDAGEPLDLVIKFKGDLRWMWPYPEGALGGILYGFDGVLNAFHLRDRSGDFYCIFGGDLGPGEHISGRFTDVRCDSGRISGVPGEGSRVLHALTYRLDPDAGGGLDFVMAGSSSGREEAEKVYRLILASPGKSCGTAGRHYRELLEKTAGAETPDRDFDEGYRWAVVGTDRFKAATPGLGAGLMAGYGASESGWDGGHRVSGRPGYAWYFGRDGAWASLAVDAYGDFDSVRDQLDLFEKHQDISGKIFHELTTSGVVHYDAADSTPLYVILSAHYLRASGDLDFVRGLWPSLKKAMEFMYSTDSDGDGLIENTNVGHGWVESGFLFGAHCTLYLAGLWARALLDAAYMAKKLGEPELGGAWMRDAVRVGEIINDEFWNERTGFYNHGKMADGTYCDERTIMPAPLMGFGLLDDSKVESMLDEFAGNAFSTDWGVRILSSASRHFNPGAYHAGTVWPLYTGWTALAEFEYGRSPQGFTHVMNSLLLKRHWALGFVGEVLHGTMYQPAGVCPHQCWSETGIIHPAVEGMVGFKPDALERKVVLSPRFPLHWNTARVSNLRVGRSNLNLEMERDVKVTKYRLTLVDGEELEITFKPEVPEGISVSAVKVDGSTVEAPPGGTATRGARGLLSGPVRLRLSGRSEIEMVHSGGVGLVPHVPRPEPGDRDTGFRIVSSHIAGDLYTVNLEGRPGGSHRFRIRHFDNRIASLEGCEPGERRGDISELFVSFGQSTGEFTGKSVKIRLG